MQCTGHPMQPVRLMPYSTQNSSKAWSRCGSQSAMGPS